MMGKKQEKKAETWVAKMKEYGGGDFTFLSMDGETLVFIVVGLPILLKSVYKGKEQERIGCPIVTEDGFQLFICGKRVARRISKLEKVFGTNALMVTRHGAEGDINARYTVLTVPEKETFDRLSAIAAEDFTEDMIDEAVKAASEVMKS